MRISRFPSSSALCAALLAFAGITSAASDDKNDSGKKKEPAPKPCTIRSPSSGHFFDLNSISVAIPKDGKKTTKDGEELQSWHAKGYDYGANFTLNFCAPVVEELKEVEGIEKGLWRNVSAYYMDGKRTYSIGQQNSELVFRGSKLVLNYTNGSPCDDSASRRKRSSETSFHSHSTQDIAWNREDDKEKDKHIKGSKEYDDRPVTKPKSTRRKSTIISLLCQKDVLPNAPKASVAFVGASEDHCTYFFEARSAAACAGIETTPSQLSPGGVFGVIIMIAILVYLVGGCVYQRTVMHQRGWRQLPNYSMWAGVWGFFSDIFIILTSSCARFMPGRRGYSRISISGNGHGGRDRHSEDENRLIDQLDEEWD